jgi:SAM-dependent methyltransferase
MLMAMLNSLRKIIENRLGIVVSRKHSPFQLELYERLYSKDRLAEKPFYNIGAGTFWHPYWMNIEYASEWYAPHQSDHISYDLMALQPLPIKDCSAEIFYTSHTIEHVKDAAASNLFAEAFRALKQGGIIRVTCPDAETSFRAMMSGDKEWFYWDAWYADPKIYKSCWSAPPASAPIEERWLNFMAATLAPLDVSGNPVRYDAAQVRAIVTEKGFEGSLDFFTAQTPYDPARPMNHISWWSHDKVMRLLRDAGFKTVYRSGRNQSTSPLMRNSEQFDSRHPQVSLYVEAIK